MARRYRKKALKGSWKILLAAAAVIVVAVIVIVILTLPKEEEPEQTLPQGNTGISVEYEKTDPIELGQGLRISRVGAYTGIYMEDGTNEVVTGTMMVILENTSEKDLQLARFTLQYADTTAQFEVTNLPAGASVVTLEKNRRGSAGAPQSAELTAVTFFQQEMSLMDNTLKLTGQRGSINVENTSGTDISGDIWVYYKYSATDIFYGGITFRAKLAGGLKAGESAQLPAGHYDPDGSKLVWVTVGG